MIHTVRFGWLHNLLWSKWLRNMIEQLKSEGQKQLPITIYWQTGTIKGRIIIDEF